ncbi:hypothetical protein GWI33_016272 [Rhynchophorus ferrugineus]|uniref:Elongation of very long chain fatty acids protein n=1 Tax=Rhynchophorus ferrugineus TaxID=354439 RepID=A0A834M789_RHYFE|nr:hypothetical protein GWI33_016272 [Rhynchophorus ferrugineus]
MWGQCVRTWNYLFNEISDPRAADLLFMSNPILPIVIVALYLGFVLKWGPAYMKNKKPYKLKKPIIAYNIVQIIVNFYIFLEGVKIWKTYNWMCEPFDASYSEKALWGIRLCHAYFLIKIVDLLDTVFFVFRKKQSQITVLHVWHHSIMVLGTWIGVKYLPSGHGSLFGVINTLVHCFLYTYYLLAILGPEMINSIYPCHPLKTSNMKKIKIVKNLGNERAKYLAFDSLVCLFEASRYPETHGPLMP